MKGRSTLAMGAHLAQRRDHPGKHVLRSISVLAATTTLVGAASMSSASAVPQDPNGTVVAQECTGGTGSIVTLHPGAGKALWDVTTQVVSSAPSYLIKSVVLDIYENGEFVATDSFSFGNKTGVGEVVTCTFTETFTTPEGNLVEIFGSGDKVRL
jgi:hypothetical protein